MSYGIYEDAFWWQVEEEPHSVISKFISVLREEQDIYYRDLATYAGLFNGKPPHSRHAHRSDHFNAMNQPRLTFNIVHSICQAATAKIAKHRPAVSFLTEGGSFSKKRKAKMFKKLMQGQFYSMRLYKVAQRAFLDCCIMGTGAIKLFNEFGSIKGERVPTYELTLDPLEVENGNEPRQLFQTKKVSKHILVEMFPDKRNQIMETEDKDQIFETDDSRHTDMIECHEAWHLPSGPDANDGRHIICTNAATLLDEPWERDHFPFAFIRWSDNPSNYWGNGLGKEVKGIQVEINKLLARIQEQMHLATPKVFIEDTSKIVQSHLNNRVWGAIKYRGTPPQFFVPRSVSGEMFAHLDRLVDRAYEMTGISQLAAQSKKPVGLESGRALREFSDIESERFMVVGQAYEQLFLDMSEQIIRLIRDSHTEKSPFKVISFDNKTGLEKVKWTDISLEDDEYVIQIKPIGSLPQTPAAKLASVAEMHMNGFFTTEEAHQLLDFPDLEQANKMKTSYIEVVDMIIESLVEKGEYVSPEPYMNLEYAIARLQQAYNLAIIEQVPDDRMELLRRWISQANSLIEQGNKPPAVMAQPGAGPPGAPGPLPAMGPPPGMPLGMPPGMPQGMPPGPPPMLPPGLPPMAPPGAPPMAAPGLPAMPGPPGLGLPI